MNLPSAEGKDRLFGDDNWLGKLSSRVVAEQVSIQLISGLFGGLVIE